MDEAKGRSKTAEHYADQWNPERGFREFVVANPAAAAVMPAKQLGWTELFLRIRREGTAKATSVYDAGCGTGLIMEDLFADPAPANLTYLGADLNPSVLAIEAKPGARIIQWDIAEPILGDIKFDFIICRAALHHTPDPAKSFSVLARQLTSGGTLAVSVYAKKAPMREACDDALREQIVNFRNEQAWSVCRQFSLLGRDLQSSSATIHIEQDLPFLGIKAGVYSVQTFIYDYFLKCWYNSDFGLDRSDLVNFDWYHPPYAYRFTLEQLSDLAAMNGLRVERAVSIKAQHYIEAVKR